MASCNSCSACCTRRWHRSRSSACRRGGARNKSTAARNAAVSSDLPQTDLPQADLPQADLSQANVIRWCVLFMNDPSASCRWSCGKVGCGNGLKVWDKNKIRARESLASIPMAKIESLPFHQQTHLLKTMDGLLKGV